MYVPMADPGVAKAYTEANVALGRAFKAAVTGQFGEAAKQLYNVVKPTLTPSS